MKAGDVPPGNGLGSSSASESAHGKRTDWLPPSSAEYRQQLKGDVDSFWELCLPAAQDEEVLAWGISRGFDHASLARCEEIRAVPPGVEHPSWAAIKPGRSWSDTGHRAILPLYDCDGNLAGLRARLVRDNSLPKALSPMGQKCAGLVFANSLARQMLRGESPGEHLVIVEGDVDFLTWAMQGDYAVLGVFQGAWSEVVGSKVPDGVHVLVRTHQDSAGESYFEQIRNSLMPRCRVSRSRRRPGVPAPDENDLLQRKLLPREPWTDCDATWQAGEGATMSREAMEPRPQIMYRELELFDILDVTRFTLEETNDPPRIFLRGGKMVRIHDDAGSRGPYLQDLSRPMLTEELTRRVAWLRRGHDGRVVPGRPEGEVVSAILDSPPSGLPDLEALSSTPICLPNGNIITEPGYCEAASRYIHYPAHTAGPSLQESLEPRLVQEAFGYIQREILRGFSLVGAPDVAHALCALLLPIVRTLIDGPTPLHLITAASQGSGKTLLANAIGLIGFGRHIPVTTMPGTESEVRKKITAILMKARPAIILDNINSWRTVASDALAACLTATLYSDRKLGSSTEVELPIRCLWLATANNPTLNRDIARRSIPIRLDAGIPKPWLRDPNEFRHPHIMSWIAGNRDAVLEALLVLVQNWVHRGMPRSRRSLGMFESWSGVMGGILDAAGIQGFLGNLDSMYEDMDPESKEWESFVLSWWDNKQDARVTATELLELILDLQSDVLLNTLGTGNDASQRVRLGKALAAHKGRIIEGFRICSGYNRSTKAKEHWLERVGGIAECSGQAGEPGGLDGGATPHPG